MGNKKSTPTGNAKQNYYKISIFHLLLVLLGSNLLLLFSPELGMLHSFLYIPDLYIWSAVSIGSLLLFFGFRGIFKKL